jgi:hypothetical protein
MHAYHDLGRSDSAEWTEITGAIPALDPEVASVDIEFVATGGMCWADDVSLQVVGEASGGQVAFEDACTAADAWVLHKGGAPEVAEGALVVPAEGGLKTRRLVPAGPAVTYALSFRFRGEPRATLVTMLSESDDAGRWLGTYTRPTQASWPEWTPVTCTIRFAPESRASQAGIEFAAAGGRAWVKDVRLVRGQPLSRR